jgi:hypothetical protein
VFLCLLLTTLIMNSCGICDQGSTSDCCTWFGVLCLNGAVTGITLYANEMRGTLPSSMFTGLPNLQTFDLYVNQSHKPHT